MKKAGFTTLSIASLAIGLSMPIASLADDIANALATALPSQYVDNGDYDQQNEPSDNEDNSAKQDNENADSEEPVMPPDDKNVINKDSSQNEDKD